ncbi:MAG: asparaginase domain-containing protein [Alphaproteobacteria bacterium]|nr:asparaginase domain-containing protein [Alphaproteobacteria bacterium]
MTIAVLTTGGTIGAEPYPDPVHPPRDITLPPEGVDYVRDVVASHFFHLNAHCLTLPPRDSKDIDACYRWILFEAIAARPEKAIAVTHGSDAAMATLDALFCQFCFYPEFFEGKKIVVIGSMTPLANGPGYDALPNLAFGLDLLAHHFDKLPPVGSVFSRDLGNGVWGPDYQPHYPDTYDKIRGFDGTRFHFAARPGVRQPPALVL